MKKFIVNLIVIFLIFLDFFNINCALAQRIVCKVENEKYTTRLFLLSYDDNDEEEGYVWGYTFWENLNSLDDNEKQFLKQIDGKTINEEDSLYDQILRLSEELHEIGYNPAMGYIPQIMINMNMNMFEILRSLLESDQ